MHKCLVIILSLTLLCGTAVAQKEANIWYFGQYAGLDFSQSPPLPLSNGQIITEEGCASISDRNGTLLFYTSGIVVMNAQHKVMKGGSDLYGDRSSTQGAVIVPLPGNDSLYYIFTVSAQNQPGRGLYYSIVNMRRENGLGEVVQANTQLCGDCFEKVAAIRHCNKRDFWILVRQFNVNEYKTYLLTANGLLAAPVSSSSLVSLPIAINTVGAIKFSSDGKKMAAVYGYSADRVELMDFDNTTGKLTNSRYFKPSNFLGDDTDVGSSYGLEFSPDSRLLYVTVNDFGGDSSFMYQFDATAANIIGTRQPIYVAKGFFDIGNIQAAPDKKLYVAFFGSPHLGIINNPDVLGSGCNFNKQGILIRPNNGGNHFSQGGLPTFSASTFNPDAQPYDFDRLPGNCTDRTLQFIISRTTGIDSVKWDFGDGFQSVSLSPIHLFTAPGIYQVKLTVYKADCAGVNDVIIRPIWIAPFSDLLGPDKAVCAGTRVQIGIDIPQATYLWNTGEVASLINADSSGQYRVQIKQNGCLYTDSINVLVKPSPVVKAGADTVICLFQQVQLDAGLQRPGTAYLWNTGAATQTITVTKTGIYQVRVSLDGCSTSDTVKVDWGDCDILLPSAFTPNVDGINDDFGVLNPSPYRDFSFTIFNRWGQAVFSSRSPGLRWDGNLKGLALAGGAYPWIISYTNRSGKPQRLKGTVLLIR